MKIITVNSRLIDHISTGAVVRYERVKREISLRVVARGVKISSSYLSDLERGRRNWTRKQFDVIAKFIRNYKPNGAKK